MLTFVQGDLPSSDSHPTNQLQRKPSLTLLENSQEEVFKLGGT